MWRVTQALVLPGHRQIGEALDWHLPGKGNTHTLLRCCCNRCLAAENAFLCT
jgi:hypothetical protein